MSLSEAAVLPSKQDFLHVEKNEKTYIVKCKGRLYYNSASGGQMFFEDYEHHRVKLVSCSSVCYIEARNISMMKNDFKGKAENGRLMTVEVTKNNFWLGVCTGIYPFTGHLLFLKWNGTIERDHRGRHVPAFLINSITSKCTNEELLEYVDDNFIPCALPIDSKAKFLNTIWEENTSLFSSHDSTVNIKDECVQSSFDGPDIILEPKVAVRIQHLLFSEEKKMADDFDYDLFVQNSIESMPPPFPHFPTHSEIYKKKKDGSSKSRPKGPFKCPGKIFTKNVLERMIEVKMSDIIYGQGRNGKCFPIELRNMFWKKTFFRQFALPFIEPDESKIAFLFVSHPELTEIKKIMDQKNGMTIHEYNKLLNQYNEGNALAFENIEDPCRVFVGNIKNDLPDASLHEVENIDVGGHMIIRTASIPDKCPSICVEEANMFFKAFGSVGFGGRSVTDVVGFNCYNMIRGESSNNNKQIASISFYYGPSEVNMYPLFRQDWNHVMVPHCVHLWNRLSNHAILASKVMETLNYSCLSSALGVDGLNPFAGICCCRILTQGTNYLGFGSTIHTDDNDYFPPSFEKQF